MDKDLGKEFSTDEMKVSIFVRSGKMTPLLDECVHQLIDLINFLGDRSSEMNQNLELFVNFPNHYLPAAEACEIKWMIECIGLKFVNASPTGTLLIETGEGKTIAIHFHGGFLNGFMSGYDEKNNNKASKEDDDDEDDDGHFSLTQEINF